MFCYIPKIDESDYRGQFFEKSNLIFVYRIGNYKNIGPRRKTFETLQLIPFIHIEPRPYHIFIGLTESHKDIQQTIRLKSNKY